jgi:cytochrome P450
MMDCPIRMVPVAPGRLPILGHIPVLWRNPLRFLESLRTVGDIVRVDLGNWPVYVLTSPELVREALTGRAASLARGRIYDRARSLFGNGLATSDGALHHRQRRLIQPAFHRARIAGYADIMCHHAAELAAGWQPGQRIDVDTAMHDLTMRTVVSALFSADLGPAATEVRQLMPVVMKGIATRMVTPKRLDNWPIPANRRFDLAAARLRHIVSTVIAAYRADGCERDDLLSMLSATTMTDEQVCDEVISLLMAGTETPGLTLAWTFHELAAHPDAERRLHAELDTVIGDRPVTHDDLPRLTYTSQILNEALRLHSVLLFTRRATATTNLGGVVIPPGTEVAYSPYALHRDPRVYGCPARFDPDRSSTRLFAPFGAGHHKCIGDFFAMTEMQITLATIAGRWRLRPAPGHRVREVIAEVPRPNALPMVVERR